MRDLGAGWMRVTLGWADIEVTAKGSYSHLARFDSAFEYAAQSGAKVVVTVYKSPTWASGVSNPESPPLNPQDYADFMRFAAARWGDKVDAWEIWNEQNSKAFWSTGPNPAKYAELLKAAYPAVKAVDPTALVLYGGVSHNDYRFIEQSYAAVPNLGDYYDVMATHPYPTPATTSPEYTWRESDGRLAVRSFASYREIRDVMLANGDDKPMWLTEFGWSTNTLAGLGVSESIQAAYYTRAMQCLEQDDYVDVAIWYIFRNHHWAGDANTWLDQLGLVNTDFTKKLAYDAFKSYTPGNVGCTYIDGSAVESTPDPNSGSVPADSVPDTPTGVIAPDSEEPVGGPPQRRSPRLSVRRATFTDGLLAVDGAVAARAVGGTLRLVASYDGLRQVFTARIQEDGTVRARRRLPGGADASVASVGLVYMPNQDFHAQWVVLQAGAQDARLRVRPEARVGGWFPNSRRISGTVVPEAHGSVLIGLVYRANDGRRHTQVMRSKIRDGSFGRSFTLPSDARNAMVYVVYAGDAERGIGGSSRAVRLR